MALVGAGRGLIADKEGTLKGPLLVAARVHSMVWNSHPASAAAGAFCLVVTLTACSGAATSPAATSASGSTGLSPEDQHFVDEINVNLGYAGQHVAERYIAPEALVAIAKTACTDKAAGKGSAETMSGLSAQYPPDWPYHVATTAVAIGISTYCP